MYILIANNTQYDKTNFPKLSIEKDDILVFFNRSIHYDLFEHYSNKKILFTRVGNNKFLYLEQYLNKKFDEVIVYNETKFKNINVEYIEKHKIKDFSKIFQNFKIINNKVSSEILKNYPSIENIKCPQMGFFGLRYIEDIYKTKNIILVGFNTYKSYRTFKYHNYDYEAEYYLKNNIKIIL